MSQPLFNRQYIDQRIRKIPDFPEKGILFYDITTLFEDAKAFKKIIDALCYPYQEKKIKKVVGIDARGFLLASTMAYKLGAGISIVRKKGKLPFRTKVAAYEKEYGPDIIEMHEDTIKSGERVIIVDDLLATGGTMLSAIELVQQLRGNIIGIDFVICLTFLPGLKKLNELGYNVHYIIDYNTEEV